MQNACIDYIVALNSTSVFFYDIGLFQQRDTGYANPNIYFIAKLRVLNFLYGNQMISETIYLH